LEGFRGDMADVEARDETRVPGKINSGVNGIGTAYRMWAYAAFCHEGSRPVDGVPDPHFHITAMFQRDYV